MNDLGKMIFGEIDDAPYFAVSAHPWNLSDDEYAAREMMYSSFSDEKRKTKVREDYERLFRHIQGPFIEVDVDCHGTSVDNLEPYSVSVGRVVEVGLTKYLDDFLTESKLRNFLLFEHKAIMVLSFDTVATFYVFDGMIELPETPALFVFKSEDLPS